MAATDSSECIKVLIRDVCILRTRWIGDGSGSDRNKDSNYKASDGWYFRKWDNGARAWEFVRFTSRGTMEVRHFSSVVAYAGRTSPEGSSYYCCQSISNVEMKPACNKSDIVAGTYRQKYDNDHEDLTITVATG